VPGNKRLALLALCPTRGGKKRFGQMAEIV
jgi:hypothetical protein